MLFVSVSFYVLLWNIAQVLKSRIIRQSQLVVSVSDETIFITGRGEVNLFHMQTWANSGNFLCLYM